MATQANSVGEEGVTNGNESTVRYTYFIPGEEREFSMKKGTSIPLFLVNPLSGSRAQMIVRGLAALQRFNTRCPYPGIEYYAYQSMT